jgi:hypothetical protein
MADPQIVLWKPLLREALSFLALPMAEQVRVNGPGCVACDMFEGFDHARIVTTENEINLTSDQRQILGLIDRAWASMEGSDLECFNDRVLIRPSWVRVRELAAEALRLFGWEAAGVEPFVEVRPGIWQRTSEIDGTAVIQTQAPAGP